jgi:tRNA-dihydrouridine synthase
LGIDRTDEILSLLPIINRYPLAVLTVHARTAVQMYEGKTDKASFAEVLSLAKVPVMYNGDADIEECQESPLMVGRSFIRGLANRADSKELFHRYMEFSRQELCGDTPVLGRMKELLSYWCQEQSWKNCWSSVKICRSTQELTLAVM